MNLKFWELFFGARWHRGESQVNQETHQFTNGQGALTMGHGLVKWWKTSQDIPSIPSSFLK